MKIIILAGGEGKRLWPLMGSPKQFSHFIGEQTLFQKTLLRFLKMFPPEDFLIVTHSSYAKEAYLQAEEVDKKLTERILLEPIQKNTAPAILFALEQFKNEHSLPEMFIVSPSDHLIAPEPLFLEKIQLGRTICNAGSHLLFGIFPTYPHTGYGYIQCDPEKEISLVEAFLEKPSLERAVQLLEEGNWLWNSGIFMFHTEEFLNEMKTFQPDMVKCIEHQSLEDLPHLSIDEAFLTFSKNLQAIPLLLNWSDVGCWDSVYDLFEKDLDGNVKMKTVQEIGMKNSLIFSENKPVIAIDVQDLLIVNTEKGLLVAKRGSSQKISQSFQDSPIDLEFSPDNS